MTRLHAWCLVALLAFGLVAGCDRTRGVHRQIQVWELDGDAELRRQLRMLDGDWLSFEVCGCVPYRTPFWEVVRWRS